MWLCWGCNSHVVFSAVKGGGRKPVLYRFPVNYRHCLSRVLLKIGEAMGGDKEMWNSVMLSPPGMSGFGYACKLIVIET